MKEFRFATIDLIRRMKTSVVLAAMCALGTAVLSAGTPVALENAGFEKVMPDLQKKVVTEIRTRKGLNPEPYDDRYYAGL